MHSEVTEATKIARSELRMGKVKIKMHVILPWRWKKRTPACLLPWRGIGSVTCAARGAETAADLDERADKPATRNGATLGRGGAAAPATGGVAPDARTPSSSLAPAAECPSCRAGAATSEPRAGRQQRRG